MDFMTHRQPNNICIGCLSEDRTLSVIENEDIKEVYFSLVRDKEISPLFLCWECVRHIQRFILFKHRCLHAYYVLSNYMVNPTKLTSLSNLTIFRNNNVNIDAETHGLSIHLDPQIHHNLSPIIEENTENNLYKLESESDGVNMNTFIRDQKEVIDVNVSHTKDLNGVNVLPESSELVSKNDMGIPFVKVEHDVYPVEGYLMNCDDAFPNQDDIDSKEFNASLHSNCNYKTKVKSKRKKYKKAEDFNASDEEPLKNVSEKKHKKNKENGVATSSVKAPTRRREKPAGVVDNARVRKKLQQLNVEEGQLEMVVLSWEEVEEERQKALKSIVFTRHEYRCHHCIVGFNHRFKLDNHMKKHDLSSGEMVCDVCQVRCKDTHALSAHRRRHRVRWRCRTCSGAWSRAAVAADHAARAHPPAPPRAHVHLCAACGHVAPTLGKLRNHIKSHGARQECELCGKSFRDRTSLRTHLFIHRGEKEYSCPKCNKKFLFKKAMEVHLVTHEAPANLYCYQCDMNFKNRMSFTQHMKYSLKHIDPAKLKYACQLCDKKFIKATRLEEHRLAVHLKATPIQCTVAECVFACSSKPVLRTHMRMVHRNVRAQRNHVCHTCGKTYTTKKTLEGHIRSHTGERPFTCGLCPATFGYEAALYNHNKLVHLKVKMNKRSTKPSLPQMSGSQSDLT